MGASRSGHFPTHHQRKPPPPFFFFFFCLKYIPVPPTTVFLNSSSSKNNVLKQTERFISKEHFPPSHTSGLELPLSQIALLPDAPNPLSPCLPEAPRPHSLALIGLISSSPGLAGSVLSITCYLFISLFLSLAPGLAPGPGLGWGSAAGAACTGRRHGLSWGRGFGPWHPGPTEPPALASPGSPGTGGQ